MPHTIHITPAGVMLIYPAPTGITMIHQYGGGACLQKRIEGFAIPIEQTYNAHSFLSDLELELGALFANHDTLTQAMIKKMDTLLQSYPATQGIRVNPQYICQNISHSHEAWVHVCVTPSKYHDYFTLGRFDGVLIWNNSD